jgi:biotin operon repressor
MNCCTKCGKVLSHNEIGAHKKFVNRASTSFLCRECLAARLDIPPELIDQKIEQFKAQGCTLFV